MKKNQQHRPMQISIAIIGPGQVFGEDDLIRGRPCSTNVICKSAESEVLKIKACDFERRISQNEDSWRIVKAMALSKDVAIQYKFQRMRTILQGQESNATDETRAIFEELSRVLQPVGFLSTSPFKEMMKL